MAVRSAPGRGRAEAGLIRGPPRKARDCTAAGRNSVVVILPGLVALTSMASRYLSPVSSVANPKCAQVCGALGCELRVQKRHYKDRVASVLIDSEVRTSAPKMLTNFGNTSAANPKLAQVCGALGCELRVQKRHYKDRVASVLIDSEVSTSVPKMLTNFGIGTLVPRNRSSHKFAERSDANFGFRSGTTRIELLVSLSIPKFVRARRKCLRTSESGH